MRSVSQTLKVTEAMRLISTSRLRKARKALSESVPYFKRIRLLMEDITEKCGPDTGIYFDPRLDKPNRKTALLVITGDRGMAGGFHHKVISLAESLCAQAANPYLLMAGSLGTRYFLHTQIPILEDFKSKSEIPSLDIARRISYFVQGQYRKGLIDEFHIVYTKMHSVVKILPESLKLLPLDRAQFEKDRGELADKTRVSYSYEPSYATILESLVPEYVEGVIYATLVESYASEQSSRMTAMDSASKNAREMLDKLSLKYNRARQAIITAEVSEIVSGAAALE
jgi:F-type H+-transporting ATPase subunit gamma